MPSKLKGKSGITLIALVVTIIVLIILAGISINLLIGDNGIITRAKDVAIEQAVGQRKEAVSLAIATEYANKNGDKSQMTVEGVLKELQTTQNSDKIYATKGTTLITSTEGNTSLAGATFYFPEEINGVAKTGIVVAVDENLGVTATTEEVEDASSVAADIEVAKANITTNVTWSNGVPSITYSETTGANVTLVYTIGESTTETTLASTSGTITNANITLGTTVNIFAKANGKYSNAVSVTVQDTTGPTISSFAVVTADTTQTNIKVSVTATDNQSGLATSGTYTYYLNNTIYGSATTSNTCTYENLTAGTEYTFKVVVKDKAENTTTSSNITGTTAAAVVSNPNFSSAEQTALATYGMAVLSNTDIDKLTNIDSTVRNNLKTSTNINIKGVLTGGVPVPVDFEYKEGTSTMVTGLTGDAAKNYGVVVTDENDNEWVWIPVNSVESLASGSLYNGRIRGIKYRCDYSKRKRCRICTEDKWLKNSSSAKFK